MKYVWVLLILDTYENTLTDVKVFDKPEYAKETIRKLEQYDIGYNLWRRKVRGEEK